MAQCDYTARSANSDVGYHLQAASSRQRASLRSPSASINNTSQAAARCRIVDFLIFLRIAIPSTRCLTQANVRSLGQLTLDSADRKMTPPSREACRRRGSTPRVSLTQIQPWPPIESTNCQVRRYTNAMYYVPREVSSGSSVTAADLKANRSYCSLRPAASGSCSTTSPHF